MKLFCALKEQYSVFSRIPFRSSIDKTKQAFVFMHICLSSVCMISMWRRGGGQAAEASGPAEAGVCEDAAEAG